MSYSVYTAMIKDGHDNIIHADWMKNHTMINEYILVDNFNRHIYSYNSLYKCVVNTIKIKNDQVDEVVCMNIDKFSYDSVVKTFKKNN